jgi:ferredoxin
MNVRWDDGFASILELAEACDVPVRWSCRTGVCHTCETGLLEGDVAYTGTLEPPAVGNLLACCSRPRGELAVDL